jgi:beta-glucanase (GH16 family)
MCGVPSVAFAAPPSSAWVLAWADEFNGTRLDASRWAGGALPWGGRHHNDQYASYIMPEDAYLQNGALVLRCRKAVGSEFGGYPYSEGFIHTNGKQNYAYGYLEIRARFPGGRGVWPACWTLPQGWPPEFDIAEYFGSDDRMHMGLAYGSSWQDVKWSSSHFYGSAAGQWHSYGLEWGPGYAVWYKDGVPQKHLAAAYVPAVPMYVILNSGMRWDADASTPFPNCFEVDYCRLYRLPATIVNDNTTGSGVGQFRYTGPWSYWSSEVGAFLNDNHWSDQAQASYQLRFTGARLDLYGAKAPNHGIAAVSIDGGAETLVDCFAPKRIDKALLWSSPSLAGANHVLGVRVTGTKNPRSIGLAIPADRVDVWPVSGRLAGTVLGTAGSFQNSGHTRARAFDGDLNTFFDAPLGDGAWVGLDLGLGAFKRVTRLRYGARPGYAGRMTGGRFQGANFSSFSDASDLYTIGTEPPEEMLVDQAVGYTGGFRYVRYLAPGGAYGNVAEVEFFGVDAPPAVPQALEAVGGTGEITLSWNPALGAARYNLWRSDSLNGVYVPLASLTTTNYVDRPMASDVTYFYRVSAVNAAGEGAGSDPVAATAHAPPILRAIVSSDASALTLTWPGWAVNYGLWGVSNLAPPVVWRAVTNAPALSNGWWCVSLPTGAPAGGFYRLHGL